MTELELRAHRMQALGDIENLMSLRTYYRAVNHKYTDARWLEAKLAQVPAEFAAALGNTGGRDSAEMPVDLLASPVIEIAEDGMSAKGLWYMPGFVLRYDDGEDTAAVRWVWKKCGGDFVYEDGQWKIFHLQVCTDMSVEEPDAWTDPNPVMHGLSAAKKDVPEQRSEYDPTRIPVETLNIPEPFPSLDKT